MLSFMTIVYNRQLFGCFLLLLLLCWRDPLVNCLGLDLSSLREELHTPLISLWHHAFLFVPTHTNHKRLTLTLLTQCRQWAQYCHVTHTLLNKLVDQLATWHVSSSLFLPVPYPFGPEEQSSECVPVIDCVPCTVHSKDAAKYDLGGSTVALYLFQIVFILSLGQVRSCPHLFCFNGVLISCTKPSKLPRNQGRCCQLTYGFGQVIPFEFRQIFDIPNVVVPVIPLIAAHGLPIQTLSDPFGNLFGAELDPPVLRINSFIHPSAQLR